MPGAWYPEDRFQRIFLVRRGMPTPKSYQALALNDSTVLVFRMLEGFIIDV